MAGAQPILVGNLPGPALLTTAQGDDRARAGKFTHPC